MAKMHVEHKTRADKCVLNKDTLMAGFLQIEEEVNYH
jgi:acyl-[acyl carrier protein]--UDP-N-acetylglucosamine O-acyltransferase